MSLTGKKWVIQNHDSGLPLPERLLKNRGITWDDRHLFLDFQPNKIGDPQLLKGMAAAVHRIRLGIERQERIMIFGDYDADGVSATAILYKTFKSLGAAVSYRIPHRAEDGYGLKDYFVEEMVKLNVKLIVTVDTGIAAAEEVKIARKNGIDVIITDHHKLPEHLPEDVVAILNPHQPDCHYPYPHLSGSMVAYKLAQSLLPDDHPLLPELATFALIGLVADCMPLEEENRHFAKWAMPFLRQTKHSGLIRLAELLGIKLATAEIDDISFYLAPCINAAGRLDSAHLSLQFFINEEKAVKIAEELFNLNRHRQELTEQYFLEAEEILQQKGLENTMIMVGSDHWHPGVIGLIAGRLVTKYARPAIAMTKNEGVVTGSARSLKIYDITAALTRYSDLFLKFGGHAEAAGFALPEERVAELVNKLQEDSRRYLQEHHFQPELLIESEVWGPEISLDIIDFIDSLAPFGQGNPEPIFCARDLTLVDVQSVGRDQRHLKLQFVHDTHAWSAIAFGWAIHTEALQPKQNYDVAFTLQKDLWTGTPRLILKIQDIRPAE